MRDALWGLAWLGLAWFFHHLVDLTYHGGLFAAMCVSMLALAAARVRR